MQFNSYFIVLVLASLWPLKLFADEITFGYFQAPDVKTAPPANGYDKVAAETEFKITLIYRDFIDNEYFKAGL